MERERYFEAKVVGQRFMREGARELPFIEAVPRLLLLFPMLVWTAKALAAAEGAGEVAEAHARRGLRLLDRSFGEVRLSELPVKQRKAWQFVLLGNRACDMREPRHARRRGRVGCSSWRRFRTGIRFSCTFPSRYTRPRSYVTCRFWFASGAVGWIAPVCCCTSGAALSSGAAALSGKRAADAMADSLAPVVNEAVALHGELAFFSVVLLFVVAAMRFDTTWRDRRAAKPKLHRMRWLTVALSMIALGVVVNTAVRGGELVYRYRVAVQDRGIILERR